MNTKALAALAITATLIGGACSSGTATNTAAKDEVFLEPAGDDGTDPFTDSVSKREGADVIEDVPGSATLSPSPAGIESSRGSEPGLYGGSRDEAVCDSAKLVEFLESEPEKATAWASALGIDTADIGDYVSGLLPVLLLRDTRVTNHGYRDGQPTPRQSVLQAGTAVLIDNTGVPRVRCACGNPLVEPEPIAGPVYVGTRWDGFDPVALLVVVAGGPMTSITLVDVDSGDQYEVPFPGGGESGDAGGTPVPGDEAAPGDGTDEDDSGDGSSSGSYEDCWQRAALLMSQAPEQYGVDLRTLEWWQEMADEVAQLQSSGQIEAAREAACELADASEEYLEGLS